MHALVEEEAVPKLEDVRRLRRVYEDIFGQGLCKTNTKR